MLTFLTFTFLYFLPVIIAVVRDCKNSPAIFILTMLAGWTGVGWFIALWWALFGKPERAANYS
ncbi:superinfection immunity protein [Bdellovibrio bacteriovorus]|uniref:superinfection immunity protein n=1 Tax=Bdellovibrio bacteriovorus TaxID=959 RepID=UPI00324B0F3C